ncbi:MFS transporter [Pseudoclavibacter endophyticus]|uniref:MFS transporter n=1 Tax=Pseudoclavibacter endophyticus TaxID=1778590 RepID=A0A6H9WQI6_9MICO|nr:MFS transporter [Pseudoclavibacter endophyticus]KAB1648341.1 MFS transporter [Pseudoclavibacter endophyticus]GGA71806.1 MFS transporter [Pseudoclavibacter endophyticus]
MALTNPIPLIGASRPDSDLASAPARPAPHDRPGQPASARQWAGLIALALAVFTICTDATVLDLAIPAISEALRPTGTQLLWIIDVYSFIVAGLLLTMGTLGDRIGRRRLLLIGSAGFAVASGIGAFATSAEMLIAARALLGIAGATLMPSTLGLIRTLFDDARQRSFAIGVWAAAAGAGTAVGPLLGGWLLERFWWGSVFIVNIPVMVVLIVAVPLLVHEARDTSPGRFDLVSAIVSIAAVVGVVYAIKEFAAHGFRLDALVAGTAGLALGWWFVRRQRRPDPMLDLSLFAIPRFSAGVASNGLSAFAFAGVLFVGSQYLQTVLGFGPLAAGLMMLPGVGISVLGSLIAAPVADRVGPGRTIAGSLVMSAAGAALLAFCGTDTSPLVFMSGYALLGVGAGVVTALASDLVVGAAPAARASNASSISETGYELGISLGVAVLGSVVLAIYRSGLELDALDPAGARVASDTIGGAMAAAHELGGVEGALIAVSAAEAFVSGMHVAAVATAIVMMVTAAVVLRLLRERPRNTA